MKGVGTGNGEGNRAWRKSRAVSPYSARNPKLCRKCNSPVDRARLRVNSTKPERGIVYYTVLCPPCLKEHDKKRNETRVRRRYGVGPAPEGTKCAICGRGGMEMCVDHDHSTGKFRDYLCHKCNRGLGYLCDDPLLVLKAADYLIEHKKRTA